MVFNPLNHYTNLIVQSLKIHTQTLLHLNKSIQIQQFVQQFSKITKKNTQCHSVKYRFVFVRYM